MNNVLQFFNRFFQFVFSGKIEFFGRIIDVDEANPEELQEQKSLVKDQVKNQLIVKINWLLMGICVLSFVFIIIYPLLYPDKPVPDIIQNAFFTTLGWFGGVLGAFFQVEQNKSS